jgi:hypothetical protein
MVDIVNVEMITKNDNNTFILLYYNMEIYILKLV